MVQKIIMCSVCFIFFLSFSFFLFFMNENEMMMMRRRWRNLYEMKVGHAIHFIWVVWALLAVFQREAHTLSCLSHENPTTQNNIEVNQFQKPFYQDPHHMIEYACRNNNIAYGLRNNVCIYVLCHISS